MKEYRVDYKADQIIKSIFPQNILELTSSLPYTDSNKFTELRVYSYLF